MTSDLSTTRFARFVLALERSSVPADAAESATLHFLDALGCGLAAAGTGEGLAARTAVAGSGGGDASIIGERAPASAAMAALANGTLCHALDFDDTHPDGVTHVSAVLAPASLAAAQSARADGTTLLMAYLGGAELTIRLGMAASGAFHRRGFHPTSVCGVFGAAAASARLLELTDDQAANALGVAGSFAGGVFEYLSDGSATKPLHAGWAAHGGVLAALIARAGGSGPRSVFDGRYGLYATHADGSIDPAAFEGLGDRWELARTSFKAYPACHYMHGCLDAVEVLRGRGLPDPSLIESIEVAVPPVGIQLVLEPAADKPAPRTPYDAKFSLPWALAELITRGRLDTRSFTGEAIDDPDVVALARRVTYREGGYASAPGAFPGSVRIVTSDGSELSAEVLHERGHRRNPMTRAQVVAKFEANAQLALAPDDVGRVVDIVLGLDDATPDALSELGRTLASATSRQELSV
ncbi:MAG TPA: MmgE/PrpD family protein [Thermoleophilaceae bacterium]|nr:MmgE/PrpD family protein [Thermoleophilaceae bacterium]